MVVENSNQQSTTGKLASGYMKIRGYTNIVGSIIAFIIGGLIVLIGIILSWVFSNFFPLIFSGIGLLIILAGYLGLKSSKKMREGKYYQVGKGWVTPE
jgi:hypothetical protein